MFLLDPQVRLLLRRDDVFARPIGGGGVESVGERPMVVVVPLEEEDEFSELDRVIVEELVKARRRRALSGIAIVFKCD